MSDTKPEQYYFPGNHDNVESRLEEEHVANIRLACEPKKNSLYAAVN